MKAKEAITPTSTNMIVCSMPPITGESIASIDPGLPRPKDDANVAAAQGICLGACRADVTYWHIASFRGSAANGRMKKQRSLMSYSIVTANSAKLGRIMSASSAA